VPTGTSFECHLRLGMCEIGGGLGMDEPIGEGMEK